MKTLLALGFSLMVTTQAWAGVSGAYATPLGTVTLTQKGKNVVGVMAETGGPCAFKKGQQVLKGALMDDSVTGTVHICSETPGCKEQDAFVVLLVARKGDLLSGAVQSRKKECKLPLDGKGIAFAKTAKGAQKSVPKAAREKNKPATDEKQASAKNPKKPPPDEKAPRAKDGPKPTQKAVEAPFATWNPDMAQVSGSGRADAQRLARGAEPLLRKGQYELARPILMEAIQTDPAYAEGYLMMGVTYFARDNYDDALDWYKKALTVNPDFGDAYYNIACIYSVEGKKTLALKYLRIALLNGYAQPDVIESDNDLDAIRKEPEYAELLKIASGKIEEPPAETTTESADAGAAESSDAGPVTTESDAGTP